MIILTEMIMYSDYPNRNDNVFRYVNNFMIILTEMIMYSDYPNRNDNVFRLS